MTDRGLRFDIITFGENSLDTLVFGSPDKPEQVPRSQDALDLPGGQAATVAVACRRLGWRARYIGGFGNDESGSVVRAALTREEVDVHAIVRPGVPSRRALIRIDAATGDRRVSSYRDSRLNLTASDLGDADFLNTRLLMVDATDADAAIRLAGLARAAGITTMVDADYVSDGVRELLSHIDLIVLPREVVPALSGERDISSGLSALGRRTRAKVVIATLGADGAVGWTAAGAHRVPATADQVTDTVGAGDAFRAGVAAAWLGAAASGPPTLVTLLEAGTLVASLNCRGQGAQAGLPRKNDVPAALRGPL